MTINLFLQRRRAQSNIYPVFLIIINIFKIIIFSRKKKGVALIEILPGDSKVLLVMIDGAIVVVDVLGEQNSTALIAHTESPICSADVSENYC